MPPTDNPVGRLYAILDEARRQGDAVHTREVWGRVLHVDPTNTSELFPALVSLYELIADSRAAIKDLEVNQDLYLQPLDKIDEAFKRVQLEEAWQTYKRHLDEVTMVSLEYCAEMLSKEMSNRRVREDDLEELSAEVDSLLSDAVESGIDATLKGVIVRGLSSIKQAIVEYRLRGPSGLKQALDENLVGLFYNREAIQKHSKKEIVKRYFEVFKMLVDIVAVSFQLPQIVGPIRQLLLPPGS